MMLLNVNMDEGLTILLVGMLIVFLALLLLFTVFNFILPAILRSVRKRDMNRAGAINGNGSQQSVSYTSGEQMAAVSAAVYLFLEETHDEENAIVTINQMSKSYSPWSSKIYVTHRFNNR